MAFASSCHEKLSRAWHLGRVPYTDSRAFAMKKLKSCDATESLKKLWNYVRLLQKLSHYLQQPPENQTNLSFCLHNIREGNLLIKLRWYVYLIL